MRAVKLNGKVEHLDQMNELYGAFDLEVNTGVTDPAMGRPESSFPEAPVSVAIGIFP